jgi:hypothetical protein
MTMNLALRGLVIVCIVAACSTSSNAGEGRVAKIINSGATGVALHAKRSKTSPVFVRLRKGEMVLIDSDCRDPRGYNIVNRYGPEFGKFGGNPKVIHALWCSVQYQAPGSNKIIHGWIIGKYLSILPLP